MTIYVLVPKTETRDSRNIREFVCHPPEIAFERREDAEEYIKKHPYPYRWVHGDEYGEWDIEEIPLIPAGDVHP